ncbi:MAG: hypothetical protein PW788_15815 [Micavibrio sp.]|nr:hypothetical protein [Micavibrio sp.]
MTETPATPEVPAAPAAPTAPVSPQAGKKHAFDSIVIKFIILLVGYAAPLAVALVSANLWLTYVVHQTGNGDAMITLHKALDGTGEMPQWILGASLIPTVLLYAIVFTSRLGKLLSLISLIPVIAGLVFLFNSLPAA